MELSREQLLLGVVFVGVTVRAAVDGEEKVRGTVLSRAIHRLLLPREAQQQLTPRRECLPYVTCRSKSQVTRNTTSVPE
jgi:hypothetical protein